MQTHIPIIILSTRVSNLLFELLYTATWKEKNWSGLNDIVVGKCINKRVQCVNNLLKCYVRLSVMQAEQSTV